MTKRPAEALEAASHGRSDASSASSSTNRERAKVRWYSRALLGSAFLLVLLSVATAFGLTRGFIARPFFGSAFKFSGGGATHTLNITFSGERRAGAGNVRVVMGKLNNALLSNTVTIDTITSFTCNGGPAPCNFFSKTIPVRRDGKAPGAAAGAIIWENNDSVGFYLQEFVNGQWATLNSFNVEAGTKPAHAIATISDIPDSGGLPPNDPGCATTLPVPAGKFFCPSPTTAFPNQGEANFLSRRGEGSNDETDDYYDRIGYSNVSFFDFKDNNGFSIDLTACKTSSANEICAWYRNENDLGWGRQMHCRVVNVDSFFGFPTKIACYVSNFKNEEDAYANLNSIATVAMTWELEPKDINGNPGTDHVRFWVYVGNGIRFSAQLDAGGEKFVPQLCLNCHGGTYDSANNLVTEAHFLPFDEEVLPTASGRPNQEARFRELNNYVWWTESTITKPSGQTTTPAQKLLLGMYDNDFTAGDFDPFYTPPEWALRPELYQSVVSPFCRSCHIAFPGAKAFGTSSDFLNYGSTIRQFACGVPSNGFSTMPHAQRMFLRFWQSGAPGVLATEIGPINGTTEACAFDAVVADTVYP